MIRLLIRGVLWLWQKPAVRWIVLLPLALFLSLVIAGYITMGVESIMGQDEVPYRLVEGVAFAVSTPITMILAWFVAPNAKDWTVAVVSVIGIGFVAATIAHTLGDTSWASLSYSDQRFVSGMLGTLVASGACLVVAVRRIRSSVRSDRPDSNRAGLP